MVHLHYCGQRASEACSRACSGARSGARSGAERVCALLVSDLARLRVLAWHGIVQLIVAREGGGRRMRGAAGAQLYFPREDVSFLFVGTLRSIGRWVLSPTHASIARSIIPRG